MVSRAKGKLTVSVLSFEDLTEDASLGGEHLEAAPSLRGYLFSPELVRWQRDGSLIPQPLGPSEPTLLEPQPKGKKAPPGPALIQPIDRLLEVACVNSPTLRVECLAPRSQGAEDEGLGGEIKVVGVWELDTSELTNPAEWTANQLAEKQRVEEELLAKDAEHQADLKNKALAAEVKALQHKLEEPPAPFPHEKRDIVFLDSLGAEVAKAQLNLILEGDPEIQDEGEEELRSSTVVRPVDEAVAAVTSILRGLVRMTLEEWDSILYYDRVRKVSAQYCLAVASYGLNMGAIGHDPGVETTQESAVAGWSADEEALPAQIDSMARGVIPLKIKHVPKLTQTFNSVKATAGILARHRTGAKETSSRPQSAKDGRPTSAKSTGARKGPSPPKTRPASPKKRPQSAPQTRSPPSHLQGALAVPVVAQGSAVRAVRTGMRPASANPAAPHRVSPFTSIDTAPVTLLLESRKHMLRQLFDQYSVPPAPDPQPGKYALPIPEDDVLPFEACQRIARELDLIPEFLSANEVKEAFNYMGEGQEEATAKRATSVSFREFSRGIGRCALRGFARIESGSKDFSTPVDKVSGLLRYLDHHLPRLMRLNSAAQKERASELPSSRLTMTTRGPKANLLSSRDMAMVPELHQRAKSEAERIDVHRVMVMKNKEVEELKKQPNAQFLGRDAVRSRPLSAGRPMSARSAVSINSVTRALAAPPVFSPSCTSLSCQHTTHQNLHSRSPLGFAFASDRPFSQHRRIPHPQGRDHTLLTSLGGRQCQEGPEKVQTTSRRLKTGDNPHGWTSGTPQLRGTALRGELINLTIIKQLFSIL